MAGLTSFFVGLGDWLRVIKASVEDEGRYYRREEGGMKLMGRMVACGFFYFIRRRLCLGLLGLGFFVLCGCGESMCEYPFLFLFSLLKFLPLF